MAQQTALATGAPRPREVDEAVLRAAAEAFAPTVMEWVQRGGGEVVTLSDIADDLAKHGRCSFDGYDLAKALERDGYMPDADLVAILDGFWSAKSTARREAVKAWVIAEGIKPAIAVGATVCVDGDAGCEGRIVQVNEEEAYYLVKIAGHATSSGYLGTLINFERATPVGEQVPA